MSSSDSFPAPDSYFIKRSRSSSFTGRKTKEKEPGACITLEIVAKPQTLFSLLVIKSRLHSKTYTSSKVR